MNDDSRLLDEINLRVYVEGELEVLDARMDEMNKNYRGRATTKEELNAYLALRHRGRTLRKILDIIVDAGF